MKEKKGWLKKNQIFLLITLVVVLIAWVSQDISLIGKNPFARQTVLNNPVQVYTGDQYRYYISDSSQSIYVTDWENRLVRTIKGGETSFEYADYLVTDTDGNIYVLDKIYAEGGSITEQERVLKFSPEGKRTAVLYKVETQDKEGKQAAFLSHLLWTKDGLYVSQVTKDGIYIYAISEEGAAKTEDIEETEEAEATGKVEERAFLQCDLANERVVDTAFNEKLQLSFCMKNGDVYLGEDGVSRCIYSAREHDTEEYFSMIAELTFGDDNRLYLCDVGQREIYRMSEDMETVETVIARNEVSALEASEFAEMPLYTGLNVNDGTISVLSSEYTYDEENDEEIYTYNLAILSEDGNIISFSDSLGLPVLHNIRIASVYLAILILAVIFIYTLAKVIRLLRQNTTDESAKVQLVMILTALFVTVAVGYVIFNNCNERFVSEAGNKLTNVGYLIGKNIDLDYLEKIDSPDEYNTKNYQLLDKEVRDVLDRKINRDSYMYCVIYKVKNDVVCEAYRDDMVHGAMYPMAGKFTNSIEEYIAAENDYDICNEFALSEGTYMYSLVPVYNEDGEAIAFIEAGTDYSTFTQENRDLYTKVLMVAVMAVIIIMLLFTELLHSIRAFQAKKEGKKENICLPDLIRPISFLFFMIANMSTAFLPIYGMKLWNENFPMQAEMAAALPISAEMICAAVAGFLCGYIIQKMGVKLTCIFGAGFYIAGNLLSAFAPNLWVLILANAVCGVGSGFLTIGLNTWAASYEEESMQNRGFIHINAAYLAGLNCGTVIGSIIWESFGVDAVYYVAAVGAVLIILLSIWMIGKIQVVPEEVEEGEGGKLRDLFTPAVIRFFVCITVPYLVCTAFLEYFFPIEAEQNGLSAAYISMAFLLSGLISIYIGSSLAEPITEKLGTKKAMVLASFIYAAALIYLVINPTVWSCYVVVVLFAIADSFGLSAQSVYFSSMDEVKKVGQSKALGVNSTVESITSAGGSLIFGAALLLGVRKGIFVIALMFSVLLLIFAIGERKNVPKNEGKE